MSRYSDLDSLFKSYSWYCLAGELDRTKLELQEMQHTVEILKKELNEFDHWIDHEFKPAFTEVVTTMDKIDHMSVEECQHLSSLLRGNLTDLLNSLAKLKGEMCE